MQQPSPPSYDFTDAQVPAEKGGKLRRQSQQPAPPPPGQAVASTSGAVAGPRAVNAGGSPISLHVYKASGMWVKDDIVTGDDKTTIQYYLEYPLQFFGGMDLTLHRGGKQGPLVAQIQKGGFSSDFSFRMANGWSTIMIRTGFFSKTHQFVAFDGQTRYKWKTDGMFSSDWTLTNTSNEDVIATWRNTSWAMSKDGALLVSQLYAGEVELILASCLAIEEWSREQRNNRRRRA